MIPFRSSRRSAPRSRMIAVALVLPIAVSPAIAAPHARHHTGYVTTYDSIGPYSTDSTGSIVTAPEPVGTGRSMRSSTLGNAEFPERDPIAQNFGNTAGGGLR